MKINIYIYFREIAHLKISNLVIRIKYYNSLNVCCLITVFDETRSRKNNVNAFNYVNNKDKMQFNQINK